MRILLVTLSALLFTSCATAPRPNLVNGQYFMMGDSSCKTYVIQSPTRVGCYDSSGTYMGYRTAMTPTQLQYYSAQLETERQQIAQMQAQLDAGNARLQQQTQQMLQNSQSYTAPAVSPISPTSTAAAYCSNIGSVLSCRSPLPSANFSCIQAGNVYHCRPRE